MRTFVFARLWRDYPEDIDIRGLDGVSDADIALLLEAVAADWMRKTMRMETAEGEAPLPIVEWARSVPPPDESHASKLSPALHESIGIKWLVRLTSRGTYPEMPRWTVFHAEDSEDRADAVMEGLAARVVVPYLIELNTLTRTEDLSTATWLSIERALEEFETTHVPPWDLEARRRWPFHPLNKLRKEALALSALIGKHGTHVPTTPTRTARATGPASDAAASHLDEAAQRERFAKLPPYQRKALQEFHEACVALPDLTRARPTEEHHAYLKEEGRDVVEWDNWRKYVSEALRAMLGPARSRAIERTRSMIDAKDRPKRKK